MAATRHSGLECLRIISIILIVSMHILGNTFHTSNLLNKEFILFVNTLGNTGVTLFILISGYFGIRFNTHKFFKMCKPQKKNPTLAKKKSHKSVTNSLSF